MKMRVLKVAAALRRGGCRGQTGRRSGDSGPTSGSHTPPKTAIFIRGSEVEKVMGHFHENAAFGSHGYCALGCNRGHL